MKTKKYIIVSIVLIAVLLCIIFLWFFIPWYQSVYNEPAIRYASKLFLRAPFETGRQTRTYACKDYSVTFEELPDSTKVTLHFPFCVEKITYIMENDASVQVFDENYDLQLDGIWVTAPHDFPTMHGESSLIDPSTRQEHLSYAFDVLSNSPNCAIALKLYELEKISRRGKAKVPIWILTVLSRRSQLTWV